MTERADTVADQPPRPRPKTVTITCVHPHAAGYREERDGPGPAVAWTQDEMRVAVGWLPHGKGGTVRVDRDSMCRPYVVSPRGVRVYVDGPCPDGVKADVANLPRAGVGPKRNTITQTLEMRGPKSRTVDVPC